MCNFYLKPSSIDKVISENIVDKAVNKAEEEIKVDTGNGRAKTYSCSWLSEVLTKNGYPVSSSTISRHMNGRCGCE